MVINRDTLVVGTFAFAANIAQVLTYWVSADHFLQHTGYANAPITNWEPAPIRSVFLTIMGIGSAMLLCGNQLSMFERIRCLLFDNEENRTASQITAPCCQYFSHYFSHFSRLGSVGWKSLISASSLYALLQDLFKNMALNVPIAILAFIGNLAAQFVNYCNLKTVSIGRCLSRMPAWLNITLATFCAFTYALANAALYFNTASKIDVYFIGSYAASMGRSGNLILFILNTMVSLIHFASTVFTYFIQISDALRTLCTGDQSSVYKEWVTRLPSKLQCIIKLLNTITIFFKSSINSLTTLLVFNPRFEVAGPLVAFLFVSNILVQTRYYLSNYVAPCISPVDQYPTPTESATPSGIFTLLESRDPALLSEEEPLLDYNNTLSLCS